MLARGSEVQTARVREPAARPECKPERASSTTRPNNQCFKQSLYLRAEERTYTSWRLHHIAMPQPEMEQGRVFLARHHSQQ
jgi:hypothetical protein